MLELDVQSTLLTTILIRKDLVPSFRHIPTARTMYHAFPEYEIVMR